MSIKRAFTLVELLVVIAIVVLLISLLIPSLLQAKRQSQSVTCMNNLRQIGVGCNLYALSSNNVVTPPSIDGIEWHANYLFRIHMGLSEAVARDSSNSYVWKANLLCPTRPQSGSGLKSLAGTYGLNHEQLRRADMYQEMSTRYIKLHMVNRPRQKLLIADSHNWELTYEKSKHYWAEGLYTDVSGNNPSPTHSTRFGACAYRHGEQGQASKSLQMVEQRINVLYFDFHVENVTRNKVDSVLDDVWLYWK